MTKRAAIVLAALLIAGGAFASVGVAPAGGESPVTVAATGDLGSGVSEIKPVADLMKGWNPDRYLLLGDLVYPDGQASGYSGFFDQVYGPVKSKIVPAPGNHDYHTSSGAPFFAYFPDGIPRMVDIGNGWVVITVNTEVSHSANSAQELAVRSLAASAKASGKHIIAITHHPRYTACDSHGDDSALSAIVADLDAAGADLFLAGHNHCYERMKPQSGNGIRFFTVGTGGNGLYDCLSDARHAYCDDTHHGALKLSLYSDHYDWSFETTTGQSLDPGTSPTRTGGSTTTTTAPPTTTSTAPPTTTTTEPPTTTTTQPQPPPGCSDAGLTFTPAKYVHVVYSDCVDGGIVWGTTPWEAPWDQFHRSAGWIIRGDAKIKNTAVVNLGDGYHVEAGSLNLSRVRALYMHDDAVENDRHRPGSVTDSTFTTYVGYSDAGENTTDGSANVVTFERNWVELLPIPGPYKGSSPGSGPFWKTDENSASLVLNNNVFIARQVPNHGTLGPPTNVKSCSGNLIVWRGTVPFAAADRLAWIARCPDTVIWEPDVPR